MSAPPFVTAKQFEEIISRPAPEILQFMLSVSQKSRNDPTNAYIIKHSHISKEKPKYTPVDFGSLYASDEVITGRSRAPSSTSITTLKSWIYGLGKMSFNGYVLAGSAPLLACFSDNYEDRKPNDADFYPFSTRSVAEEVQEDVFKSYKTWLSDVETSIEDCIEAKKLSNLEYATNRTDTSTTVAFSKSNPNNRPSHQNLPSYQMIHRGHRTNARSVVVGFDQMPCKVLYYKGSIYFTLDAALCYYFMINPVDWKRESPSHGHRIMKYAKYGFVPIFPGLEMDLFSRSRSPYYILSHGILVDQTKSRVAGPRKVKAIHPLQVPRKSENKEENNKKEESSAGRKTKNPKIGTYPDFPRDPIARAQIIVKMKENRKEKETRTQKRLINKERKTKEKKIEESQVKENQVKEKTHEKQRTETQRKERKSVPKNKDETSEDIDVRIAATKKRAAELELKRLERKEKREKDQKEKEEEVQASLPKIPMLQIEMASQPDTTISLQSIVTYSPQPIMTASQPDTTVDLRSIMTTAPQTIIDIGAALTENSGNRRRIPSIKGVQRKAEKSSDRNGLKKSSDGSEKRKELAIEFLPTARMMNDDELGFSNEIPDLATIQPRSKNGQRNRRTKVPKKEPGEMTADDYASALQVGICPYINLRYAINGKPELTYVSSKNPTDIVDNYCKIDLKDILTGVYANVEHCNFYFGNDEAQKLNEEITTLTSTKSGRAKPLSEEEIAVYCSLNTALIEIIDRRVAELEPLIQPILDRLAFVKFEVSRPGGQYTSSFKPIRREHPWDYFGPCYVPPFEPSLNFRAKLCLLWMHKNKHTREITLKGGVKTNVICFPLAGCSKDIIVMICKHMDDFDIKEYLVLCGRKIESDGMIFPTIRSSKI